MYVWCGLLRILLYISRDRAEEVEEVSDGRFGFNHKLVLRYVLYYYVYIYTYIKYGDDVCCNGMEGC